MKYLNDCLVYSFISIVFFSCSTTENKNLYLINENKKRGFIDTAGNVVIPPKFRVAGNFSEGLALASLDSTFGYINESGQFVIEPTFTLSEEFTPLYPIRNMTANFGMLLNEFSFSEDYALFVDSRTHKFGYINKKGNVVIAPKYSRATKFKNGFAVVCTNLDTANIENTKVGLINNKGELVIKDKFFLLSRLSSGFLTGCYCVRKNDGLSFTTVVLNKTGNIVNTLKTTDWPILFDEFNNGYTRGYDAFNGMFGIPPYFIYDSTGQQLNLSGSNEPAFFKHVFINEGKYLWIRQDKYYQWVKMSSSANFSMIDNKKYDTVMGGFNKDGIACVKYKKDPEGKALFGFVDTNGVFVIQPKFSSANNFKGPLAPATIKTNGVTISGYINKKGEYVWSTEKLTQED